MASTAQRTVQEDWSEYEIWAAQGSPDAQLRLVHFPALIGPFRF